MGIQAVIHGKLSSSGSNLGERLEDLMTSNIFQLLSYLTYEKGLKLILESAINSKNGQLNLPKNVQDFEIQFWPKWSNCEPDILITLFPADKSKMNILIEAKLFSGLSSEDQLLREWKDLTSQQKGAQNYLIYLTSDSYFPNSVFNQTKKLEPSTDLCKFYWLNYEMVYQSLIVQSEDSKILKDIIALLSHYYFVPFKGWQVYKPTNKYLEFYKEEFAFQPSTPTLKYQQLWTEIKL